MSLGRIVSVLSVFCVMTVCGRSVSFVQVLTSQEIPIPKLCQCLLSPHLFLLLPNFTKISCVLSEPKPTYNLYLYATNVQAQAATNVHVLLLQALNLL